MRDLITKILALLIMMLVGAVWAQDANELRNFKEMDKKLQKVLSTMEQTVSTLNNTTKDIRRFGLSEQTEIQSIIRDIRGISTDLNEMLNTGKQDPAWILFGDPPPRINFGDTKSE